ncbi:MAG: histidine kinase dimerization/phosphoacceptor domain -containing protein [Crocinitomicaceae bacterium]
MSLHSGEIRTFLDNEILDKLLEGFQLISYDWKYLYLNDAICKQGKYSREELLGQCMLEKYPGIEKTKMFSTLQKCMKERVSESFENKFTFPDGSSHWFELRVEPVTEGIFILSVDIDERKKQEEKLQCFHEELEQKVKDRTHELEQLNKEVSLLYKEMHHRIKNNLQIVSSLLSLQASKTNSEEVTDILQKSCQRIHAIAHVHENLYKKERIQDVNLKTYLNEIIRGQQAALSNGNPDIKFAINCNKLRKSVDFLIPIGLLINELITNSIRHAFRDKHDGKIVIQIQCTKNKIQLNYSDNGLGFSPNKNIKEEALGNILIDSLVEQLDGHYDLQSSSSGTVYNFEFPQ